MKKPRQATAELPAAVAMTEQAVEESVEQPTPNGNSGEAVIDLTGIKFAAPKQAKGKSTRPFCSHTTTAKDGTIMTCQLRAQDGQPWCANHAPAEQRLTEQEGLVLSAWLEQMTPAERLVLYVRAVGWFKAKEQVKAI